MCQSIDLCQIHADAVREAIQECNHYKHDSGLAHLEKEWVGQYSYMSTSCIKVSEAHTLGVCVCVCGGGGGGGGEGAPKTMLQPRAYQATEGGKRARNISRGQIQFINA